MDKTNEAIFKAKAKQIDIELEQKLTKIDEEFRPSGFNIWPNYEKWNRSRELAELKADAQKDEIRAELEKEEKLSTRNTKSVYFDLPSYDKESAEIHFRNKTIPIRSNTIMENLCRVIFSKKLGLIWLWEDVLKNEEWGEHVYDNNGWRKVYGAADRINQKVVAKTGLDDFLLQPTIKEIQINPKYLT